MTQTKKTAPKPRSKTSAKTAPATTKRKTVAVVSPTKTDTMRAGGLRFWRALKSFGRRYWIGLIIIALATTVFFAPLIIRTTSYSPGGDPMFNAWTLARDQHCILRQNCPSYADGNIYFPHKSTMLYSETQLSAGLLTLPLYLINHNPLFAYNIWTILSFFFAGFFMYLLAKYLSKGNEPISILAGLIFEFAPFKVVAVNHLQNLSIFCLPLAVLLVLKYVDSKHRKYLWLLAPVLLYQFYASWYQLVFMLIGLATLLGMFLLLKIASWRSVLMIGVVIAACLVATLPLAKQYVAFSKQNKATFGVADQALYASSVYDYTQPFKNTILGKAYYHEHPAAQLNAYNLDSDSYHGIFLYVTAIGLFAVSVAGYRRHWLEQERYRRIIAFGALAVVGFVISLGPLLKLKGSFSYGHIANGAGLAMPLPYLLVDKFLPQLSFIRAIGRASVLMLFALCCILAYLYLVLDSSKLKARTKKIIIGLVFAFAVLELLPLSVMQLSDNPYAYNLKVPAVYKYISSHKDVDNIVTLQATNYPNTTGEFARPEGVMWAGYANKNFFNGYSGYTPPNYFADYTDFVNFQADDIAKLQKNHLRYVLVDKKLMASKPEAVANIRQLLSQKVYEDSRYALFKI